MSLCIDIDKVTAVLLADGWHEVADDSFHLDSYEYIWRTSDDRFDDPELVHGGGNSGICATGFGFQNNAEGWIYGPLTSIVAVSTNRAARGGGDGS